MKFTIPYPPTKREKAAWNKRYGLNAYYAGKHWSQRRRDAEELHTLAQWAMKCSPDPAADGQRSGRDHVPLERRPGH